MADEPQERATADIRAVIARYVDAWQRGDLRALQDCYHDDFTVHYFGRNPLTGTHSGKQRALATLAEFSRRTRRQLVRIEATMAGPERGAVIARERFGNSEGVVELERVLVYSIADGRLRECWVYDADPAVVDRLLNQNYRKS